MPVRVRIAGLTGEGPDVNDIHDLVEATIHDATGAVAGQFTLTPAQVQELAASRYYVQLHSEKAAEGNLWGWLMPQERR